MVPLKTKVSFGEHLSSHVALINNVCVCVCHTHTQCECLKSSSQLMINKLFFFKVPLNEKWLSSHKSLLCLPVLITAEQIIHLKRAEIMKTIRVVHFFQFCIKVLERKYVGKNEKKCSKKSLVI